MQREIRLTPILLVVLSITTALMIGLILLLWGVLPSSLQSGLPFAISTVVLVNTVMLRVIPQLGKRLAEDDPAAQKRAAVNAPPQPQPPPAPPPAQIVQPPRTYTAPAAAQGRHAAQFCTRCGSAAQRGDAFCRRCGNALALPSAARAIPASPPPSVAHRVRAPIVSDPLISGAIRSATPPALISRPGDGPMTSVSGAVAVSARVHTFMSKRSLRYLLFIGTSLNIVAIVIYSIIGIAIDSCSAGSASIDACSASTATTLNVLIVLALIIWLPGFVLVLLVDIFALIRTALVRRWGWFVAILVCYIFLWNVAMFLYVFIGPDGPPPSQNLPPGAQRQR